MRICKDRHARSALDGTRSDAGRHTQAGTYTQTHLEAVLFEKVRDAFVAKARAPARRNPESAARLRGQMKRWGVEWNGRRGGKRGEDRGERREEESREEGAEGV